MFGPQVVFVSYNIDKSAKRMHHMPTGEKAILNTDTSDDFSEVFSSEKWWILNRWELCRPQCSPCTVPASYANIFVFISLQMATALLYNVETSAI